MRVLGLIPARGGSKGVPRKNVRSLEGRPLLSYVAAAASAAATLARIIVSTDDEEIAAVASGCGIEVPFRRPADLGRDDTPTLPVIQHALDVLEAGGDRFDAVCLLQPTSPCVTAAQIDACVRLLDAEAADAVVTVRPVPVEYNPHWVYFRGDDGSLRLSTGEAAPIARRQALPPAYHRAGSVYVTRVDCLRAGTLYGRRLLGLEVDADSAVNIDSEADLVDAARVLRARRER
ncbi:MAG: acylneuraminate cytidylyltransferase family protein [Acidobacteria bacterium]|nr:acylneuraminate cytidylyltransferase family protein [Acidobacteriota bacterium]